jgi:transcriptional regulator with XRE-family HTH domain
MADEQEKPLSVVARNLKALIGEGVSVNSWALRHKLTQTTINRIVTGKMSPTADQLDKIAAAVNEQGGRIEGWHLMVQSFSPRNPPILLTPSAAEALRDAVNPRAMLHREDGASQGGDEWLGKPNAHKRRATDK